ncbi:MAG TPA: NUDIX hydrolase [Burkholderiales bacterium]|nr:NUDIX hydrolase [Burkholderiales bacterium]
MGTDDLIWKPHVTVAAVAQRDGRFLVVEEETDDGLRFNQPAGHLDPGESLADAAIRETFEETAYRFRPTALLGVYQFHHAASDTTYLRFAFAGTIAGHDPQRVLDHGIIRAVWLTPDELRASVARHRTPLVIRCIEDYLAGRRYPLDLLHHYRV